MSSSKNSSLDLLVEIGGAQYVKDPESGALYPTLSGAQDLEYLDTSFDTGNYGSYDSNDYSGFEWASPIDVPAPYTGPLSSPYYSGGSDILGSQGTYGGGTDTAGWNANPSAAYDPSQGFGLNTPNYVIDRNGVMVGIDPTTGNVTNDVYGPYGGAAGGGGGLGAPGGQAPLIPGMGSMGGLNSLLGILGAGGTAAGLIGALAGGGVTGRTTYPMSAAQRAQAQYATQSLEGLQPFIQGMSPNQIAQNSLLQQIAAGQIPQSITDLVRSAYAPVLQNLWTDASNAGRQAGFYDAPASSPPGGAILGPGLAQVQGQEAGDILKQMTSLPGIYNTPINNQIGAAQNQASGYTSLFGSYKPPQTTSAPLGPQVGQIVNQGLTGLGSGIQQGQTNANQQNFNNLMTRYMLNGGGGTTPSFSGTYSSPGY